MPKHVGENICRNLLCVISGRERAESERSAIRYTIRRGAQGVK